MSLLRVLFQMPVAPSNKKVSKNGFRHSKEHKNSCLKQTNTQNQEMAQDDSFWGGASHLSLISVGSLGLTRRDRRVFIGLWKVEMPCSLKIL